MLLLTGLFLDYSTQGVWVDYLKELNIIALDKL